MLDINSKLGGEEEEGRAMEREGDGGARTEAGNAKEINYLLQRSKSTTSDRRGAARSNTRSSTSELRRCSTQLRTLEKERKEQRASTTGFGPWRRSSTAAASRNRGPELEDRERKEQRASTTGFVPWRMRGRSSELRPRALDLGEGEEGAARPQLQETEDRSLKIERGRISELRPRASDLGEGEEGAATFDHGLWTLEKERKEQHGRSFKEQSTELEDRERKKMELRQEGGRVKAGRRWS